METKDLIALRKENKIMQKDIAEETGYTVPYVCLVENGKMKLIKRFEKAYLNAIESIKNKRK